MTSRILQILRPAWRVQIDKNAAGALPLQAVIVKTCKQENNCNHILTKVIKEHELQCLISNSFVRTRMP